MANEKVYLVTLTDWDIYLVDSAWTHPQDAILRQRELNEKEVSGIAWDVDPIGLDEPGD